MDPKSLGKQIARAYLTKLGWVRELRRNTAREIRPMWTREEMEDKAQRLDALQEEAEGELSSKVEELRVKTDSDSKETLYSIYEELKTRTDMGFIGKRIVAYLKNKFEI